MKKRANLFNFVLAMSIALALPQLIFASDWQYMKPITLSSATSQDNYQIKVELTTSNFNYSHAKSDGGDLRFHDGNGTELSYWIENWDASGTSTIWVKVTTSGTNMIYMYYGNSSASSVSNGDNTFEFFDDFSGDLSKWDTGNQVYESNGPFAYQLAVGYNAPHISDGNLIFDGIRSAIDASTEDGVVSGWWGRSVKSKESIAESNFIVETRMWFTQSSSGTYAGEFCSFEVGVGTDKDNYIFGYQRNFTNMSLSREVANTRTNPSAVAHTFEDSKWKNIKFTFINNGNCEYKIDSDSQTYSVGQSLSTRKVTLAFDHRASSASVIQKVDWVFVRKYASPEPVATVGDETVIRIKYVATNGSNTPPYDTWGKAASSIQAAIDAASAGDIIIVGSSDTGHGTGEYTENVDVNKSLTIKSERGSDNTTVIAKNAWDHVFDVQANSVTIGGENCGFSIYGATGDWKAGIYLGSGITGCTIQDNRCGWDNTNNNDYGIYLVSSSNNTLTNNNASNNNRGIYLSSSSNNTLTGNTANNNYYDGIYLDHSSNNTLTGNTASSNASYGIYLEDSGNNTLTGNTASSNYNGIYLEESGNNTLTGNTASSNADCGIYLDYSCNANTLTGNTASSNTNYGIYLYYSSNDTLTDNTMSGNQYNFSVEGKLLSDYTHNIDASNMVESKPIYYWVNQQNKQIPSDAGYVGIVNSNNIIVKDLTLGNNGQGVLFAYTAGSRIENVNASNNSYGIYLNDSCNANTLTGNTASFNASCGIYLKESGNNTLTGNTASFNAEYGIHLYSSSNNTLTGNTADNNEYDGIELYSSCNANTLTGNTADNNGDCGIYLGYSGNNTLTDNTADNNYYDGIYLVSSSNNTLTGNTADNNEYEGIELYSSCNANTLTGNTADNNGDCGIYLYSSSNNTIYLNNLSDNSSGNTYVNESSGNIWNSPTPIYYDYTSGSFHKNYLGNYYGDYNKTDQDSDGDGIGNTAYNGTGMTDSYPLMDTSACYSLQAWWLNSDSKMYRDDRSKAPGSVTISNGGSHIWIADQAALMDINFSDGTWTGQIVFTSAPESDHTFTIEIGSSTDGSDFTAGPSATITGDDNTTFFNYETSESAFTITTGNYLALRITNNSSSSYAVQTGGAWSYCSSPNGSGNYFLSVEFVLFTGTISSNGVELRWQTAREVNNYGFEVERKLADLEGWIKLGFVEGSGNSDSLKEYSYVDTDIKEQPIGKYYYRLKQIDTVNASFNYSKTIEVEWTGVSIIDERQNIPKQYALRQNYPNPFNPVTTIAYDLPEDVYVELTVYNMLGEKVTTLIKGNQPAGYYNVEWDGRNSQGRIVSSGMYFLRISAGSYCKTNKMVFVR